MASSVACAMTGCSRAAPFPHCVDNDARGADHDGKVPHVNGDDGEGPPWHYPARARNAYLPLAQAVAGRLPHGPYKDGPLPPGAGDDALGANNDAHEMVPGEEEEGWERWIGRDWIGGGAG